MRGKAWEEGQECGIVKVGLGTWAQRKERGWRGSGTLHEGHGSLGCSSAESTFGTLSRRRLGGACPGLPGHFPRRAPRAAKQANLCADRGTVPGRNGRASCGSHSAVLPHARAPGARRLPSPARAPLQGRRGRPVSPAPISRAFRSSSDLSASRLCSGRPPRPRARALTWAVSAWHHACRPPWRARSW